MIMKLYNVLVKGGNLMTQFIRGAFRIAFDGASKIKMRPMIDYQKHVPRSARQLAEDNWKRVGDSLGSAMDKVRNDNEPRV